jgi:hypothetical protein
MIHHGRVVEYLYLAHSNGIEAMEIIIFSLVIYPKYRYSLQLEIAGHSEVSHLHPLPRSMSHDSQSSLERRSDQVR